MVDYNVISKVYDDVRESDLTILNHFLHEISFDEDFKALDIGCGTGNYTDLFQKLTQAQVYGIEPSEGMLKKAQQKNAQIVFRKGTATNIPFEGDFFDFAYMTDVIHHVLDIEEMFSEIRRVLKHVGKVCIVTQSHQQIAVRPIAQFFPATVKVDQDRYPDLDEIICAAQGEKLKHIKQEVLFTGQAIELDHDYLELVWKKGYSMLHLISPEEYNAGVSALEDALQNGPVQSRSAGETLIWFVKA